MKHRAIAFVGLGVVFVVIQFLSIHHNPQVMDRNRIKSPLEHNESARPSSTESQALAEKDYKKPEPTQRYSTVVAKFPRQNPEFDLENNEIPKKNFLHTEQTNSTNGINPPTPSPSYKDVASYPTMDDCVRIIEDGQNGRNMTDVAVPDVTDDGEVVSILQQGCDNFMKRYHFMSKEDQILYSTPEELDFAIAYTILAHKNLHQIATLLSAIYRNQNIYCVHVDTKSAETFAKGIKMMAKCFHNIFEPSKRERVVYASFSRLQAEVNCMKDLLATPSNMYDWKYLVNLCGQDFPVSTNLEIVNQLKSMNGKNCFSGTRKLNDIAVRRVKYVHEIRNFTVANQTTERVYQTRKLLEPPPYNLTTVKSIAYAIFTRNFLQWALVDSKEGAALFNWSSYTKTPDEHFWGTLHVYPKAPGWSESVSWRSVARAILWRTPKAEKKCGGYWQHSACVFGGGAMWWLTSVKQLFVNKFDISYDATPIRCLRKLLDERTRGNASNFNPNKKPMKL